MILGFELTLLIYITMAGLFRLLFAVHKAAALWLLVIVGTALLTLSNPLLTSYLAAQVIWVLLLYVACRKWRARAVGISWLAFLGLVPFNINLWFADAGLLTDLGASLAGGGSLALGWAVGAPFFVIKSFVALREAVQEGRFRLLSMLAGLTFVPAFPAGPIFGSQPFRPERIAPLMDIATIGRSVAQLGWGAAAFFVVGPLCRAEAARNPEGVLTDIADIYLNLAGLFFDFSGYTLMAIALAGFFGITLPQNFNRPYLATSIRKFWQRWHMSLSWFVSTYLFKPFVRKTGSAQRGIFLAFTVVGLWHEVSPGYLLWGLGHGAALSIAMKPPAWWNAAMARLPKGVAAAIGWFLTMTWVALLSHLATLTVWGLHD